MGKHEKTKEDKNIEKKNIDKKNIENPKKGKKKRHIILKIFLVILIALTLFVVKRLYDANWNILGALLGHNAETLKNLDKLQVLILGESTGMSDTIIVASYDPKTQDTALLSIPRDTFTGDNKKKAKYYEKINALYNHGETPEKTRDAVNKITGMDLNYYILVDTEALIKLVDIIGGLYFDVPIDMNYDDGAQNLHIHLKAGYQKLDGAQVEGLVRFRHNNDGTSYSPDYGIEDHGRNRTQREVIIAIAKQSLQFKNITEISNIIDVFKQYVKTNMNLNDVKDYLPYAIKLDTSSIKVGLLPGRDDIVNGVWYFFHDEEETQELVNELFYHVEPEVVDEENEEETNSIKKDD